MNPAQRAILCTAAIILAGLAICTPRYYASRDFRGDKETHSAGRHFFWESHWVNYPTAYQQLAFELGSTIGVSAFLALAFRDRSKV